MDYYFDIKLLSDSDFLPSLLMNALFGKLHRALVESPKLTIAVSFPEYSLAPLGLGGCLRVHGSQGDLDRLNNTPWLAGVRDHVICMAIKPVPAHPEYVCVQRVQVKSNVERLVRRCAKRNGIDEAQARCRYQTAQPEKLHLPFVTLNSQSSGQKFSLFIKQGKPQLTPSAGEFNRYGLSRTATIPWF